MKNYLLFFIAALLSVSVAFAQSTVTGTVTEADTGDPIVGAAVLIKGTTIGAYTDEEGQYRISLPDQANTLVFTYVGRSTLEEQINGRSVINVAMEVDALDIDEVVVTAVGIEANRRTLGYAVQNVDADEIVNAREVNIVNALNSKVAGVTVVSSSGSPGASANIRIRGSVSIGRSNSPLFVIDGVPIDNSSSGNGVGGVDNSNRAIDINPNDIESLTVLKGPAATVLYGIRAANGAVIITTKSGKRGKPTITVNSSYTFDEVNKLPEMQSTYAQGRPVDGVPTWRGPNTFEGFSWGPLISELEFDGSDYPFDQNGRLVPRGQGNGIPARAYDPYDFFVTGQTYDLNASVSGGTDNVTYFLSAGRLASQGVVPNSTFERNSFRVKVESNLTEKLKGGISANFVNSGGDRIQRGSNISGVMLGLLRTTPTFDNGNGKSGEEAADDPDTYLLPDGTQRSYRAGIYDNPYWTVNKNPFTDDVNRIIGYTNLSYEVAPWFTIAYKLGIDHYTDRRLLALDINSADTPNGLVQQSTLFSNDLNSDLLLQFNTNISNDLSVNATVGHNYFSTNFRSRTATGTTLAAPDFYNISNATDIIASEGISRRKLVGVFGTANLSYKNFLFLNLSARNDWSSTLPEGENSFFYPAASLGFTFTDAFGIADNPILPYGKIRVSWGQVGNDAPIYATQNFFNSASSTGDGFITGIPFPSFGVNAFERSTLLGNNQLKPETTTTIEFGAELKFLQGRLGLDVTYFDSESEDQVISVNISSTTGFTSVVQNAGIITNKGWEGILTARPVEAGDFSWDIDVNFTRIRNEVEELAEGIENIFLAGFTSTSSRAIAGEPYGALFGNKFQTDDQGRTIIGDNGWPLVDPIEQIVGDPNPDWLAGIRNTFNFKGLSVSALLDIREGGDMWCGTCGILDYFGTSQQSADERNDRVVFEGVNQSGEPNTTEVALADPAAGLGSYYRVRYGFGGTSEGSIFDSSWRRLREVTVSYSFPQSWVSKLSLQGATLQFTGRNLWLDTDYPGIDPETNLTGASNGIGLDYFNMPNTRSYGAALRLVF